MTNSAVEEQAVEQAKPVTEEDISSLSDELQAAHASGNVAVEWSKTGRTIEGKGKIEKEYLRVVALNYEGALAIVENDDTRVWDKFNVGVDMGVRSTIGQQIVRESEGPEKYIGSAAKGLAKVLGISVEDAAERIKAMSKGQA